MSKFGDEGHKIAALIVGYLNTQVANDALFACPLFIHRLINSTQNDLV